MKQSSNQGRGAQTATATKSMSKSMTTSKKANAMTTKLDSKTATRAQRMDVHQRGYEMQKYGELRPLPLGLEDDACKQSVEALNQVLADTMTLRDLYKKHHWQVSGPTFYQLHLLFDKHYEEQSTLIDTIAERIQTLGGISVAMAADVAEMTKIERPPRGREEVPVQISRLLEAHEQILKQARDEAEKASDSGDEGTNDLLISDVVRTNELQVWFIAQHLQPENLTQVSTKADVQ